jgi:hypothetical protein
MIHKHSEEFENACKETNTFFIILEEKDKQEIMAKIQMQFGRFSHYNYPLWENLTNYIGITFSYAWEWFEQILKQKEVYFLFEPEEQDKVFIIADGGLLPSILNNAYKFTFYVTDSECSFLLCFNDHDNLIAVGQAKKWLIDYTNHHHPELKIFGEI